jgi:hypothetical protein
MLQGQITTRVGVLDVLLSLGSELISFTAVAQQILISTEAIIDTLGGPAGRIGGFDCRRRSARS